MPKLNIKILTIVILAGVAGVGHAQRIIENFEGYGDGVILRNTQEGSGPRWNSSGGGDKPPLVVKSGKGVGGSNAVASIVRSVGLSNTTIPGSVFEDDGSLTVQVDVNVSGKDFVSGQASIEFMLGTLATWNGGASGIERGYFGVHMGHLSDLTMKKSAGNSPYGTQDHVHVDNHGELTSDGFPHSEGTITNGDAPYNAQSMGWVQVKLEVDRTWGNNAGAFFRDIDDATGAAIGPWTGGQWDTVRGGTFGQIGFTGFFWDTTGVEIEVVALMSKGSGGNTSYFDNLIIGSGGIPGDYDDDGDVDGDDFLIWQNHFPRSSDAGVSDGDADGDGDVDGDDFLIWQNHFSSYGSASGSATTPEPTSLGVLVLGGFLMLRLRRAV